MNSDSSHPCNISTPWLEHVLLRSWSKIFTSGKNVSCSERVSSRQKQKGKNLCNEAYSSPQRPVRVPPRRHKTGVYGRAVFLVALTALSNSFDQSTSTTTNATKKNTTNATGTSRKDVACTVSSSTEQPDTHCPRASRPARALAHPYVLLFISWRPLISKLEEGWPCVCHKRYSRRSSRSL